MTPNVPTSALLLTQTPIIPSSLHRATVNGLQLPLDLCPFPPAHYTAAQRNLLDSDTSPLLFKHIGCPVTLTALSPASGEPLNGLSCPRQPHLEPSPSALQAPARFSRFLHGLSHFLLHLLSLPSSGPVLEHVGQMARTWKPERRERLEAVAAVGSGGRTRCVSQASRAGCDATASELLCLGSGQGPQEGHSLPGHSTQLAGLEGARGGQDDATSNAGFINLGPNYARKTFIFSFAGRGTSLFPSPTKMLLNAFHFPGPVQRGIQRRASPKSRAPGQ